MRKKNKIEEIAMDYQTYKKISGSMNPKDKQNLVITGEKPTTNTSSTSPSPSSVSTTQSSDQQRTMYETEGDVQPEAIIEPQDKETLEYLSNVKDGKTNEISQPFIISNKKYQMVRAIKNPSKEIVMGVYCYDEMSDNGLNIIHPIDYFEENIAKPMKGAIKNDDNVSSVNEMDFSGEEIEFNDKEQFMDYLNLSDVPGYKHFFVNIKTGEVSGKFKTIKEMMSSGIKLGPNEDYMDVKGLKRFRFGTYFKKDINEESPVNTNQKDGINIPKLQSDVKKLADMIKNKFSIYLSKLDKPIEQAQFLTAMANEIGVPLNKLSSLISTYKDISVDNTSNNTTESKKITKKELEESLNFKKVIKTIKVKNIK